MTTKRLLIGVLVLALALGLAGCKSIEEKIGEEVGEQIVGAAVGADVEVDGDSVTVQTDEGEVTLESGDSGKLPKDFPDDFPMYDDVTIDGSSAIAGETDQSFYVNLLSDDDAIEIIDWYKSEFESDGWKITSEMTISEADAPGGMLVVEKDKMNATVTTTGGDSETEIGLILVVKK